MVATGISGGVACITAFLGAFCFASFLMGGAHEARVMYGAYSSELGKQGLIAFVLRKGVTVLRPLALVMLKSTKLCGVLEDLERVAEERGYKTTTHNIASLYAAASVLLFFIGLLMGGSVFLGVLLVLGGVVIMVSWLNHLKERRLEAIREAVPDALRSMSVCSHVGYSLQQTFMQVGSEIAEPLKALFLRAAHDLETGKTADEALAGFRERVGVPELSFVAVSLDVQHKAGGSLRQVLEAARDSVESELELKRTLRVQTAQAKLSARIVSLMPFILIALFSFLSPGFLDPFFRSAEGFALFALAGFMQVAGIFLVRKLLDVAVD